MSSDLSVGVSPELQHEVEQFLFAEARMLDERRVGEWLEHLADDVHYFMPTRYTRARREAAGELSGPGQAAHFDDDKASMRQRVKRLQSSAAWSEEPWSRTRHLVTNVQIRRGDDREVEVDASILVYRNRLEDEVDLFVGTRSDLLRRADTPLGWEVARRRIVLDQATVLASNMSMFF